MRPTVEVVNLTGLSSTQIKKQFGNKVARDVSKARAAYRRGEGVSADRLLKKFSGRSQMKTMRALLPLLLLAASAYASDVSWTRFKGSVKMLDLDKNRVTIQDDAGDLITIPVDGNVRLFEGKDQVSIDKLKLDDKIQLQYIPINQKLMQQMQDEKAKGE